MSKKNLVFIHRTNNISWFCRDNNNNNNNNDDNNNNIIIIIISKLVKDNFILFDIAMFY